MKRIIALFSVLMLSLSAAAIADAVMNIKTLDGQIFKNATVTNILPNGIDIAYTKADGTYVIRGLSFANLPEDIRKKFNYNQQNAVDFEKQAEEFRKKLYDNILSAEKQNSELAKQQNAFAKDLDAAKAFLYSRRQNVFLNVTRGAQGGIIAAATLYRSNQDSGNLGTYFVNGITGDNGDWIEAAVYPTGRTITFEDGTYPVYDSSLERAALQLVQQYQAANTNNTGSSQ